MLYKHSDIAMIYHLKKGDSNITLKEMGTANVNSQREFSLC